MRVPPRTPLLVALGFLVLAFAPLRAQAPAVEDVPSLEREVVRAHGGAAAIDGLRALLLRGEVRVDGAIVPFRQYRRRPNLVRTDFTVPGGEIREGFDGTAAWRQERGLDGPWADLEIDAAARIRIQGLAEFLHPLLNARDRGIRLQFAGRTRPLGSDGPECVAVRRDRGEGVADVWHFDARSFLLIAHDVVAPAGTTSSRFDDHRVVGGVILPHRIRATGPEGVEAETVIERIQANPGLLSDLFRPVRR